MAHGPKHDDLANELDRTCISLAFQAEDDITELTVPLTYTRWEEGKLTEIEPGCNERKKRDIEIDGLQESKGMLQGAGAEGLVQTHKVVGVLW